MANQIPLIVNAGAGQIQQLAEGDNLSVAGNIVTGNILTDGYYYANGAPFIDTNTGNITFDNTDISTNLANTAITITGNGTGAINIITGANSHTQLQNDSNANGSSYVWLQDGNVYIESDGNTWTFDSAGNLSSTGNIIGSYLYGDGSNITNLPAGDYGNANVAEYLPTFTGNLTANNISILGNVASDGKVITVAASGGNGAAINGAGLVAGANIATILYDNSVFGWTVNEGWHPAANVSYNLGRSNRYWNNFYALNVNAVDVAISNSITSGNFIGNLSNGASKVSIANSGNVSVGVGPFGTTVLNVNTSTGISVLGNVLASEYISATGNVTGNYIFGNGSQLTNLPAPTVTQDITSNGDMSIMTYDGNIKYVNNATIEPSSGNIKTAGNISATGNISGTYIFGNGSQLTGLSSTYGNTEVAAYLDGSAGNIIPGANLTYSLGNSTNWWSNIWVAGNTIYIGGVSLGMGAGNVLTVDGNAVLQNNSNSSISTTGNITADYFIGDGSQLTGITATANTGDITFTDSLISSISNLIEINGNSYVRLNSANAEITVDTNGAQIVSNLGVANYTWNFDSAGNLTLPGNSFAVNYANGSPVSIGGSGNANIGNVTFNDINIIGTGNLKLQPDQNNANAYLDIYLTGGPDIHIAGNGETIILGTDDYANVAVNVDGNVSIQANAGTPHIWNFNSSGTLNFPRDSSNASIDPYLEIGGGTEPSIVSTDVSLLGPANLNIVANYINFSASTAEISIHPDDGTIIADTGITLTSNANGNTYSWTFGDDGQLLLPNNGVINTSDTAVDIGSDNSISLEANTVVNIYTDTNGAGYQWQFGDDGNLTLPGNSFAVNYANGTQVSIGGGGNASTGNVTFNNQIVIGTGDGFGDGGLYLAVGPTSVANLQYLQVRGGDVATHIHLDTGNSDFYDQYFGDDGKYVKLEAGAEGNVVIGTDGDGYNWTFDDTGNLTVPGNIKTTTIGPAFSSNVTDVDTTTTPGLVIIELADNVFTTGAQGQVTITGVVGTTEANGTWYYQTVETNAIQLFSDPGFTIPVNGTLWTAYVSGGLAVAQDYYRNLNITGGAVSIVNSAGNAWTFGSTGNLLLSPQNVSGSAGESAILAGTRKIINGQYSGASYGYSAVLAAGGTPTVAYTATNEYVQSVRLTFAVESLGVAPQWEQFDVVATKSLDNPEVNFVVSNRIKARSSISDTVVTASYSSANQIEIILTLAAGQTGGWSSFDAVEFGLLFN
jgi:hypothetical protein